MSWVKRFVPFFLAFVLGLFVASFFVTVGLPKVKVEDRGWRRHNERNCRMRYMYEQDNLRFHNESLRLENERLRDSIRADRDFDFDALPPLPPPPPTRVR